MWGWDRDHQTYSREGYGLGIVFQASIFRCKLLWGYHSLSLTEKNPCHPWQLCCSCHRAIEINLHVQYYEPSCHRIDVVMSRWDSGHWERRAQWPSHLSIGPSGKKKCGKPFQAKKLQLQHDLAQMIYTSSHNHGSGKWVYLQYAFPFHLGWCSTSIMGFKGPNNRSNIHTGPEGPWNANHHHLFVLRSNNQIDPSKTTQYLQIYTTRKVDG